MAVTVELMGSVGVTVPGSSSGNITLTLTEGADVGDVVYVDQNSGALLFSGPPTDSKGHTWPSSGLSWIVVTTALTPGDTISVPVNHGHPGSAGAAIAAIRIRGLTSPAAASGGGNNGPFNSNPVYASSGTVTPTAGSEVAAIGNINITYSISGSGGSANRVVSGWSDLVTISAGTPGTVGGFFANSLVDVFLAYQVIPSASGNYYIDANLTAPEDGGNPVWRAGIVWFYSAPPPPPDATDISQARALNTGLLLLSYVDAAGAVATNRYNSNNPPGIAATVTHETSLGSGVSLVAMSSNRFELLYAHNNDIKRRITRDGGRTWSVATTIASGYQDVVHLIDPSTGLAIAALWKESTSEWYLARGTRSSGTGDHTYTVAGLLVGSAKRGASLIRTAARRYEFAYRNSSDALIILRCTALGSSGVGTWS